MYQHLLTTDMIFVFWIFFSSHIYFFDGNDDKNDIIPIYSSFQDSCRNVGWRKFFLFVSRLLKIYFCLDGFSFFFLDIWILFKFQRQSFSDTYWCCCCYKNFTFLSLTRKKNCMEWWWQNMKLIFFCTIAKWVKLWWSIFWVDVVVSCFFFSLDEWQTFLNVDSRNEWLWIVVIILSRQEDFFSEKICILNV